MGSKRVNTSRRKFIKSSTILAGGALAFLLPGPAKAMLITTAKPTDENDPWYGIVI